MLEKLVSTFEAKVVQLEKERKLCLHASFLSTYQRWRCSRAFYTGFPNFEAVISFYDYIKPKYSKNAILERKEALEGKSV